MTFMPVPSNGPFPKSYEELHREYREKYSHCYAHYARLVREKEALMAALATVVAPLQAMIETQSITHHSEEFQNSVRDAVAHVHAVMDAIPDEPPAK